MNKNNLTQLYAEMQACLFSGTHCQGFADRQEMGGDTLELRCVIVDTDEEECLDSLPLFLWSGLCV